MIDVNTLKRGTKVKVLPHVRLHTITPGNGELVKGIRVHRAGYQTTVFAVFADEMVGENDEQIFEYTVQVATGEVLDLSELELI